MADKTIGELPVATQLDDESLLVVEQQSQARSIKGLLIKKFARESAKGHVEEAKRAAEAAAAAKTGAEELKAEQKQRRLRRKLQRQEQKQPRTELRLLRLELKQQQAMLRPAQRLLLTALRTAKTAHYFHKVGQWAALAVALMRTATIQDIGRVLLRRRQTGPQRLRL